MAILTYRLKNIFVTYCFKPLTVRVLFLLPVEKVSLQVVNSPCFSSSYYVPGDELSTLLTCDQSFKGDPGINLFLQKKQQIPSQEAGWCQDSNAAFWVHIQDSSPLSTDSAVKPAVHVSWPACKSHCCHFSFYFMYFEALLLGTCIFRIVMPSWWIDPFVIM